MIASFIMGKIRGRRGGMETEFDPNPCEPFFLIVADFDRGHFCVEGPMTDDGPWKRAAGHARGNDRRVQCGPAGSDRRSLSIEYQRESGFGAVPPGTILRPRE
jgi:hypothetical protein